MTRCFDFIGLFMMKRARVRYSRTDGSGQFVNESLHCSDVASLHLLRPKVDKDVVFGTVSQADVVSAYAADGSTARSTSNPLFHISTSGSLSAVSTPIFAGIY